MKKYLLVLTTFFTLTVVYGQTNVYHPFPDTNAIWASADFNGGGSYGDTRYGIKGDTIITGKNYKKIYSLRDSTIINLIYAPSTYYAAIREQNKRVYTVIGTMPERLLYDFNLSVGGKIIYDWYGYTPDTGSLVVTKIDSILLLDGKYRKRWTLVSPINNFFRDTVVEGIGSIYKEGLFQPLDNHDYILGNWGQFTCFKQNDTVLYLNNPDCNHCFCRLLTAIINEKEQGKILISPNPFSSSTTLRTDKFFNDASLTVYNLYGQTVKQLKNISGQTVTFYRDNLPCGLYFLRLTENKKTLAVDKLVIVDN